MGGAAMLWVLLLVGCAPLTVEAEPAAIGFRLDMTCSVEGRGGGACQERTAALTAPKDGTLRPVFGLAPEDVQTMTTGVYIAARSHPAWHVAGGDVIDAPLLACAECDIGDDAPPRGEYYGAALWVFVADDGRAAVATVPILLVME